MRVQIPPSPPFFPDQRLFLRAPICAWERVKQCPVHCHCSRRDSPGAIGPGDSAESCGCFLRRRPARSTDGGNRAHGSATCIGHTIPSVNAREKAWGAAAEPRSERARLAFGPVTVLSSWWGISAPGRRRWLSTRRVYRYSEMWTVLVTSLVVGIGTFMADNGRMSDIIPRRTLADEVAESLVARIRAGEFKVGDRLPTESELARELDVGRSSMREAVRTLQAAGYLRSTQGRGVFVTSDRPTTVGPVDQSLMGGYTMGDLFDARVALESKTAELAAVRRSESDRVALDEIVESASVPGIGYPEFVRLDGLFHRQVAVASASPLLLHMWDSIAPLFTEYSLRVVGMPGSLARAHADHRCIADAVIAGDAERAAVRATEHVMAVRRELDQRSSSS